MSRCWVFIFLFLVGETLAQVPSTKLDRKEKSSIPPETNVGQANEDLAAFIGELERNIAAGSIRASASQLGPQVFIDISGSERGYFSSNQAVSLLQSFFALRKPVSFTFSGLNYSAPTPYATGRLTYLHKGSREAVQVYIALARRDSSWIVTHFNIY